MTLLRFGGRRRSRIIWEVHSQAATCNSAIWIYYLCIPSWQWWNFITVVRKIGQSKNINGHVFYSPQELKSPQARAK